MIQFLPLALSLVAKLPIIQFLLDKVPAEAQELAAKSIVSVVQSATGLPLDQLKNAQGAVLADAGVALSANRDMIIEHATASMTEARSMYTADNGSRAQADRMAEAIMRWNLLYICLLIIALILTVAYVTESGAVGIISAAIGAALNQLYNERNTVMSFYYASMEGVEKLLGKK